MLLMAVSPLPSSSHGPPGRTVWFGGHCPPWAFPLLSGCSFSIIPVALPFSSPLPCAHPPYASSPAAAGQSSTSIFKPSNLRLRRRILLELLAWPPDFPLGIPRGLHISRAQMESSPSPGPRLSTCVPNLRNHLGGYPWYLSPLLPSLILSID